MLFKLSAVVYLRYGLVCEMMVLYVCECGKGSGVILTGRHREVNVVPLLRVWLTGALVSARDLSKESGVSLTGRDWHSFE